MIVKPIGWMRAVGGFPSLSPLLLLKINVQNKPLRHTEVFLRQKTQPLKDRERYRDKVSRIYCLDIRLLELDKWLIMNQYSYHVLSKSNTNRQWVQYNNWLVQHWCKKCHFSYFYLYIFTHRHFLYNI